MKMLSCFRNCLSISEPIVISGHPHQFSYHEQGRRGSTYECKGCQRPGYGPCYSCPSCDFHYHKLCGDILRHDSPPISNHRPYPIGRYIPEERAPSKVRYCVACGDQVRGLRYKVQRRYQIRNNRAFHPLCALLPSRIQDPREREFVLELKERIRGKCPICKGKAKGWAYNGTCGDYGCHVGCVKKKIIQSWQQNEASENEGNRRRMTIHVEIQLPEIRKLAETAIRLIIGALLGVPNVADIFMVLFT